MPHSFKVGTEIAAGGVYVKVAALVAVPPAVVTVTFPVEPFPTTAVICVIESTVKLAAFVPPNFTSVPVKPVPVILTDVPGPPDVGAKEVMVGVWALVAKET